MKLHHLVLFTSLSIFLNTTLFIGTSSALIAAFQAPTPTDNRSTSPDNESTDLFMQVLSANTIGLDLLKQTIKDDTREGGIQKNTVVSPLSFYAALSMLRSGLQGQTREKFDKQMLMLNISNASFDSANGSLLKSLIVRRAPIPNPPGETPQAPVVGIDNLAVATNGKTTGKAFHFSNQFIQTLQNSYSAAIESLDFHDPSASDRINTWAKEKTNGLISKIIEPPTLKGLIWLLLNSTYLEAGWSMKFKAIPEALCPRFTRLDGKRLSVPMITTRGQLNYAESADYQATELPLYASDLAFYLVVPKTKNAFLRWTTQGDLLTANQMANLFTQLKDFAKSPDYSDTEVTVKIPTFAFSYSKLLLEKAPLTQLLQLDYLFADSAYDDLAPLGALEGDAPGSKLGLIKHDVRIQLDRHGLSAAAITTIGGIGRTATPFPRIRKTIIADKPFVFMIADKKTNVILFAGTVVAP